MRHVFIFKDSYFQSSTIVTEVRKGWLVSRQVYYCTWNGASAHTSMQYVEDLEHSTNPEDFRGPGEEEINPDPSRMIDSAT